MEWSIAYSKRVKRVAMLVSKMDHCLYDLLIRWKAGGRPHHAIRLLAGISRCDGWLSG